jgi:hypothetical protein
MLKRAERSLTMAINYASKYSSKVAERFKLKSVTEAAINKDYEWSGVSTVTVYSIPTVSLTDYTLSGTSRYGTPTDLENTKQDMTISKDRSFTFIIDRKSLDDTMGAMEAGKALAREIDEVVIPEVDAYRIAAMATAAVANSASETTTLSSSSAYASFLTATEWMGNHKVPVNGRRAFVSYEFYKYIKQDPAFMLASDMAKEEVENGVVGKIDGVKIIPVPTTYLPTSCSFVMCHPSATVGAEKLQDYKTHDNPPGINGTLVEGRVRYDAFVLDSKVDAVYACYKP